MTAEVNNNIKFRANSLTMSAPSGVNYNKRSTAPMPQEMPAEDVFMLQAMAEKKAEKKANSQANWNKAGVLAQIGIAVGMLLGAVGMFFGTKLMAKSASGALKGESKKLMDTLNPVDVSKEKTFEQLTLSPEMQKVVADMKTRIERADALKKKGGSGGSGIMLYGEPGGGKNAYVYALTKYMQKKFPGSELYEMNVLKLTDKYVGETENNIMGFVEQLTAKAKANPDKKFIVFMDEFDSIARKEDGLDKKMGEKFQNAFKLTLTKLTAMDNVQVIAATNKAEKDAALNKVLDEAILNRFPQKIFVPLPTKKQLKKAIVEHYKTLPSEVVDKELTDINSSKLDSICKDIAKESHHASFRDLQYILAEARIISESGTRKEGSPITIKDLKAAVKKHAERENWSAKGKAVKDKENNGFSFNDLSFMQKLLLLFHK